MKTPNELYQRAITIYNESCDGIAELMRSHNCEELNLKDYEIQYDTQLPALLLYTHNSYLLDGDDEGYVNGRPTVIRLVPDHFEIDVDAWNGGGYIDTINETCLDAMEVLRIYRAVDEIFGLIDMGVPAYHENKDEVEE